MTTSAAARLAAAFSRAERMTAAAGRNGVGIVDRETRAHQAVHIVNFAAPNVHDAGVIDQDVKAAVGDDCIPILLLVESHAVLKTGTSAASNKDTQGKRRIVLLLDQFAHFLGSSGGDGDHS